MKTTRMLLLVGSLSLVLAACTAGGSVPSPSAPTEPPASASDLPTSLPPEAPVSSDPGGGGVVDPGLGDPTLVAPIPGLANIHDVGASGLTAAVNDRSVAVRIEWTSGVEPCYALAGVDVVRDGTSFMLTVREGTADPDAACIEIAQLKAFIVELGELEPGTYTIAAFGDAAPIEVIVS